jgi:hypothetical protein
MSANVWVAPASSANLNLSILSPVETSRGKHFAWAMNAKHIHNYAKIRVGDIVLFGNSRTGYKWFAEVTEKPTDVDIEWPYPSPSGEPWSNVFFVNETTELATPVTCADIRSIRDTSCLPRAQYMLTNSQASNMLELMASHM